MTPLLFASLATNALAAIGLLWFAAKLAVTRADRDEAIERVTELRGVLNGMKSDYEIGKNARLQREQNLRTMQARNKARRAA